MKLFFRFICMFITLTLNINIFTSAYDDDMTIRLFHQEENIVENISMKEYLTGVMVGEMDASSPAEALKSVCVAARTYTLYMCEQNKNKEYDVVADASVSQAFISSDKAQNLWGISGGEKYKLMEEIVELTDGEIIEYNKTPICAFYHASSYPFTENCENVFLESLPYLRGKKSVETKENTTSEIVKLTLSKFNEILSQNGYPEIDKDIKIETKFNANQRCSYIIFKSCDLAFSINGCYLRKILNLPSTSFKIHYENDNITFETWGFGHGVGLSQNGAKILADCGKNYLEILDFYYDGTEVVKY